METTTAIVNTSIINTSTATFAGACACIYVYIYIYIYKAKYLCIVVDRKTIIYRPLCAVLYDILLLLTRHNAWLQVDDL